MLVNIDLSAGVQHATWNGDLAAAGTYLFAFEARNIHGRGKGPVASANGGRFR